MRNLSTTAAVACAVVLCMVGAVAEASQWYVLCERSSGQVVARVSAAGDGLTVLAGPLPGPRTALAWMEEHCASRRCNAAGVCLESAAEAPVASASGGWVAGELQTVTVGSASQPGTAAGVSAVSGPAGPSSAGLGQLVDNAVAAADACNYPAALASADHLTRFDPEHPWLLANHAKLRRLAERQRATEQSVWQASAALEAGKLKQARDLAAAAADQAVSCQHGAVAQLLDGIETAMKQERELRAAHNRQAAAALLPGLLDLARVASGGQAQGAGGVTGIGSPATTIVSSPNLPDPCAFRYEYRNQWSFEPVCTCTGYAFDHMTRRCARSGG